MSISYLNQAVIALEHGIHDLREFMSETRACRVSALADARTISVGTGRGTDHDHWVMDRIEKDPAHTLVVFPNEVLLDQFKKDYHDRHPGRAVSNLHYSRFLEDGRNPTRTRLVRDRVLLDAIYIRATPGTHQFDGVINPGFFSAINDIVSDDVIIYIVG